jgi:exodeoxyribonuclease VII large subunit
VVHPNRPLERGYARVEDREGRTLVAAKAARVAHRLNLVFGDGTVGATVDDGVERPRRASYLAKGDQPKLF